MKQDKNITPERNLNINRPVISFEQNYDGIKQLIDIDLASLQRMKNRFLAASEELEDEEERTITILQAHSVLNGRVEEVTKNIIRKIRGDLKSGKINEEEAEKLEGYFAEKKAVYLDIWNKELGLSAPRQFMKLEKSEEIKKLESEIEAEVAKKFAANKTLTKLMCKEVLVLVEDIYGRALTQNNYISGEERKWVDGQIEYAQYYLNNEPQNIDETKEILAELTENNYTLQQIFNQKQKEVDSIFSSGSEGRYTLINKELGDQGIERLEKLFEVPFIRDGLKALELSKNNIGLVGSKAIANILSKCRNLEKLAIERNPLRDDGIKVIANMAQKHEHLKELYLTSCDIGIQGMEGIAKMLSNNISLQKLDLHMNEIGDQGAAILAQGLAKNQSLKYLDLNETNIGNNGLKSLAPFVINREYLDLGYNHLTSSAIKSLCDAAEKYDHLQLRQLKLGGNKINELQRSNIFSSLIYGKQTSGALLLPKILAKSSDLLVLDLNHNQIGDEGIIRITNSLQVCTQLRMLRLGNNGISDRGGQQILNCIKSLPYLERVDIYDNQISNNLNKEIIESLQHNQLNSETFRAICLVSKAIIPISQFLRNDPLKMENGQIPRINQESNYFSYLPMETIFNIIKFLPQARILHTEVLAELLNNFTEGRNVSLARRDELIQSDKQQSFLEKVGQDRFGAGFSITR